MKKSQLRKTYLDKRKALSQDEVFLHSDEICRQFLDYFKPKPNAKVHIFIPIERLNEVRTEFLIKYFFENNIRVFVPKIVGEDIISVEIFPESVFETNQWQISEPKCSTDSAEKDFDFVITPLVYADEVGNRIGYGKGFYDRFFAGISQKTPKIGVGFFPPKERIEDAFQDDIPLDYLVLPTAVLSFPKGFSNSTK